MRKKIFPRNNNKLFIITTCNPLVLYVEKNVIRKYKIKFVKSFNKQRKS